MNDVELNLAKWSDRFFAWVMDFIIVIIVVEAPLGALTYPLWSDGDLERWFRHAEPASYLLRSLAFFAYWTFFEYAKGQSIGKMILRIKTVDMVGGNADVRNIMIQSFGKSFLLPLDLILGWIFSNEKRQRIFNRASNTIVIKLKEREDTPSGVRYSKE
jgi:uncharacterized RDD family membrane protein YckC